MKLNLQTDYALRVLIYVGAKDEALSTIQEIADAFAISKAHLMKVVHRLGKAGYLDTIRGKHGGMRLKRRPETIRIGDVVRSIEEDLAVIGCLGEERFCRIQGPCVLTHALYDATQAFLAVLDGYTLTDLLAPRTALSSLLGITPPIMPGDAAAAGRG
ncbi:DNA-binding protein [Aliidongia dinghuensis]|uniref:DNA-binding protein n=1 Tax=Aliidongia dinghuensis TaxID=1867774 RepID=A0A8J2YV54_9PROT|nr:Rrf2 family transcriptional regulator [Aliidongia dinghuensis]GGF26589.1 DNA-binding protein [Aliidongia dinghuensis]